MHVSQHRVLAACFCIVTWAAVEAKMLNSQISLSEVLASNHSKSSIGNVNILTLDGDDESFVAFLPYLFRFSHIDDVTPLNELGSYEGLASILLAIEHLNTGNGTIIPEVHGIDQKCPLSFITKSFDTQAEQRIAVDHIISLTDRSREQQLVPFSILGTASSRTSMPTSTISGLRGFPQISPIATSSALDDKSQFPLFGRTVPNDDGTSIPLLAKLKEWGVKHLAVLFVDDAYGQSFHEGLVFMANRVAPDLTIQTVKIIYEPEPRMISDAVRELTNTKCTYFFGIIHSREIDAIMTEAYDQGIAGTGRHNWVFSDSIGSYLEGLQFDAESKLALAFRGSGVLSVIGGFSGMVQYDKLATSMQQLKDNDDDVSYLESLLPIHYPEGKVINHSMVVHGKSFLETPGLVAPFLYDAVIAIGLASCRLFQEHKSFNFTGDELFDAFKEQNFEGSSGSLILDSETGTRDPTSAVFLLMNFVYDEDVTIDSDKVRFKSVQTDVFKSSEWVSLASYSFNDDTYDVPPDLPPYSTERNFLSSGLQALGMIFFTIIFALAVGFSFWTYCNSKHHVLRSSQPLFLHVISAGTLLMGSALIPLSIDFGVTNQAGADVACMSIPWLLAIGFSLTFSALFTKTHRVNQIMKSAAKFRRIKLRAVDVIKPMIILLLLNVVVLTVWTIVDHLYRQTIVVIQDQFGRDLETYSMCTSDHMSAFLGALGLINLGSLILAIWEAFRARKISTELQESSYIFTALALILMVSFIGIPVMIIVWNGPNNSVTYFVSASIIFVTCTSILVLIYVPKLKAFKKTKLTKSSAFRQTNSSTPFFRSDGMRRSSLGEDEGGIKILSSPQIQLELEHNVSKLANEVQELKKLLEKEKEKSVGSVEEGSIRRKSWSI